MTVLERYPPWTEQYRPSLGARLLDSDFFTQKTVWFIDQGDGVTGVVTLMPVDDMLDANAELRTLNSGRKWDDGIALAARVPMHLWQRELAEPIMQEDRRYISNWLNDPDHSKFRTKEGKV